MPPEQNTEQEALILQSIEQNDKLDTIAKTAEASVLEQSNTTDAVKELTPAMEALISLNSELLDVIKEKNNTDLTAFSGVKTISLKGDKGDSPTKKEITSLIEPLLPTDAKLTKLIKPLIPEPIKGDKGDSYVLTKKDKKDIAKGIKVPVVEKVIEHFTTVEQPITIDKTKTEIKEVAKYETAQEQADKLNTLTKAIDFKVIKNFPDRQAYFGGNTQVPGGGAATSITGLIEAGTNITIDGTGTTTDPYIINSTDTGSTFIDQTPLGDSYGFLSGVVDGSNTTFVVSEGAYTSGTLEVTLDGLSETQGSPYDFVETDPTTGTFDFTIAPPIGSRIKAIYGKSAGTGTVTTVFETNGVLNGSQTLVNLVEGTNMSIADDGLGNITFSATGGSQDLQSVTDVGNTTTNDIVGGALYAGNVSSAGSGVYLYDGANDVYGNLQYGENKYVFSNGSFSFTINHDGSNALNYNDGTYTTNLIYTSTATRNLSLPDASGTLALSVNGNTADSAGNITISTGSGTVTSVATGTGISGGPITTTGTLTANLSTGIAGGQSAIGGTASGENLTLSSTTNATKGKIIFGSASVYDEVNDRFGIGQTTPTSKLHITRDDIRVTQSDAYGIFLQNSTAATAGITVQYSPAMVFRGSTWLTTAPASSTLDYRMFARPVSGASASPRGGFVIQQSLNGGAYSDTFEVGQTIFNSNDYQMKLAGSTVFAFGGGVTQLYGGSNGFAFYNSAGSVQLASMTNVGIWSLTPSSNTATSGTVSSWIQTASFAPTSGTGVFNTHTIAGTINQTGGANGITRGIYINQTITAAADYRSLEIARGNIKLGALDMVLDTTTGTKIGTATSQKLSLWNATPIVQPTTAITAAAFVANTSGTLNDSATYGGYTIGQIVAALQAIGALA